MKKLFFLIIFYNFLYSSSIETIGDIGQILIPAVGYGATIYQNDANGSHQFYKSYGSTLAITYGLKYSIDKKRPNGGKHSFPSGHTASAFSGASFIHARYGLKYAWIAYLGASFVGYSRVYAKAHWGEDVLAGAIIGIANSFIWTTKYNNLTIVPILSKKSAKLEARLQW